MNKEFSPININDLRVYGDMPSKVRVFRLSVGDVFILNAYGIQEHFGIKIKDIDLCSSHKFNNQFMCMKKIKRKWWQIWKPKYVAAKFMVVGEELEKHDT